MPAVLSAPFQWLGGPVLAYNAALLLSLLVSGLGRRRRSFAASRAIAWRRSWRARSSRRARTAGSASPTSTPRSRLFLPFALLALDRFWEDRRLRRALLVGGAARAPGLSSVYLGAITALVVCGAAVLVMALRRPAGRATSRSSPLGFALAGRLLVPLVRPYLRMRAFQGVEFTLEPRSRTLRHHPRVVRGQRDAASTAPSPSATSIPSACRTRCSPAS